jgi:plastocyanin
LKQLCNSHSCALITLVCASALTAACFSERTTGTDPQLNAVCNLSVAALLQGDEYIPMRGYVFVTDTARVARGTRITWVNCEAAGGDPHTITSDEGVWDSPFVPVGDTFSRTFDAPGTYAYHCIPHPFMQAVVIVE